MKPSIYGKYPGKLKYDVKYIENCSEIELFIQVNKYYGLLQTIEYYYKMKHFYQAICNAKNIYEDVKIKEIERFKVEFKDLILEENVNLEERG